MNIFHKIALQGLLKNRTRTIVTVIGVALSSLLITGVSTFGVSLLDYMANGAQQKYGNWYAAFLDADASFIQERMHDEEVSGTVSFENIGYAKLDGGQNPSKPYLFIAGFQQETFDALPITLISGRLPENDSEVVVSTKTVSDGGVSYELGDTVSLSVGNRIPKGHPVTHALTGRADCVRQSMKGEQALTQADSYISGEESFVPQEEKHYTVVGIGQASILEPEDSPGYALVTRSDVPDGSRSRSLFVGLKNPRKVYSYVDKVKGGHAVILNYDVLRVMGISDRAGDKVFMAFLYSFGGIVLAIIMIGSIFLIYNSFSISLNERIREIGVLASVGATAKQLRNSVLFEGLCIGAVGIPIGILLGLGGIYLVLRAVAANFGTILYTGVPLEMEVSAMALIGAAAVSLLTILISAYLPAKKAVNLPVMECIRQTNEIKVEAGAMAISQNRQRMYGLEGTLALKNFKRNRRRYRSIVLSLVLSIVLFVSANSVIDSMQRSADGFKIVSDYDIGFGTRDIEDDELLRLYDKLEHVEGIEASSCRAAIPYICTVPADTLSDACREAIGGQSLDMAVDFSAQVMFLNDDFYQKKVQEYGLAPEEHTGEGGKLIASAKINDDSDDVEGPEDLADMFKDVSMEMTLVPEIADGADAGLGQEVSVTFVETSPPDIPPLDGSYQPEILPYDLQILAPWSMKEKLAPSGLPVDVKVKGLCFESEKPSLSMDEIRQVITGEGLASSYILMNSAEIFEQHRNYIFIANVFSYVFIALISLIAAANVFNTISTNIRLRRRELAMLRSVGMSDKDFNKMMRFECAFYGMRALVIGVPLSLIISTLGVKVLAMDDVEFHLPWTSVGISILSVFLVIFVTMMYAVSKIKKENIIDALRDEMT